MEKSRKPLEKVISEFLCVICTSLLLTSLLSFIALAGDINISHDADPNSKISTSLASKIAESSEVERIPVIIMLPDQQIAFNTIAGKSQIDNEQKDLIKFLEGEKSKNKVQDIKPIEIINAVAVKVTPEVLAYLTERPDVWKVELDDVVYMAEQSETSSEEVQVSNTQPNKLSKNAWGVDKIGAPAVWKQGITGKGITVAVVDSGIDAKHPDLDDLDDNSSTNDPKVVGWIDYVNSGSSPYDDNGHGTHVSGIISGTGAYGIQTGVAPGTKLIVAKVFNSRGSGCLSDTLYGFQWAVTHKARIINFSGGLSKHNCAFTTTIKNTVAAGVIPVIMAGNNGPKSSTITCPGDELDSLTVGATDSSDVIAYFSGRGSTTLYGQTYIKPDVSAPGVNVTSTVPGGGYEAWDGTSMATPHVSGTVALMLENTPTLTLSKIKQILESTAKDLGSSGKDNVYGSGRINASKAVPPKKPVANFSAKPTSGKSPLNVAFTDTSTGTPTKWKWNFGDGMSSTKQNPTYKYSEAGNYTVTLTVSNAKGSNTLTKTGYIQVTAKPVAAFSASPASGKAPLNVKFTDISTGIPTKWKWDFGDGTTLTKQNPTHKYSKTGKYTVKLTVTNAAGSNTATKTNYIIVTTNLRSETHF